jgi:hypothetical protein
MDPNDEDSARRLAAAVRDRFEAENKRGGGQA